MTTNRSALTKEARALMAEYMREYRVRNPRRIRGIERRSKAKARSLSM